MHFVLLFIVFSNQVLFITAVNNGCLAKTTEYTQGQISNWGGFVQAVYTENNINFYSNICNTCQCGTYPLVACPSGQLVPPSCENYLLGVTCRNQGCATWPCACYSCPAGTQNKKFYCAAFPGGSVPWDCQYSNPSTWTGNFVSARLMEYCLACTAGTFSIDGQSCVTCPAGSSCATTSATPTKCVAGTYSSAGQKTCSECLGTTFSSSDGAIACTACDVGYWAASGATSCSPCTNKPSAFTYTGSASSNSCSFSSTPSCPAGTYAKESTSTCEQCTTGTYQGSSTTAWATACTTCPAGYQCPTQGMTSPTQCANGFFSNASSNACTIICPAGQYAAWGQSQCSICKNGSFSSSQKTSCSTCESGYFSNSGASQCEQCAIGTYAPTSQSSVCLSCTAGKFNKNKASTSCSSCTTCQTGNVRQVM